MARKDLSTRDVSEHAASELEYALTKEKRKTQSTVPTMSVEEAMSHDRVYQAQSSRDVTRVLFISSNTKLLNPTTQSLDGYINISELFDEVHILILRQGIPPKNPVLRVAKNVWIYTAAAKYWWATPAAGIKLVEEQLEFASGFRPDLVVARDPIESAWVAKTIGQKYNRPTQLHVLEDYSAKDFLKQNKSNFWRRFVPLFTLKHFLSIRTATNTIEKMIDRKLTVPDLDTLPRLQSYEALINSDQRLDLKDKYRPHIFFMLFIGKLTYDSNLHHAIDAARFALKNPRVGLIVLGDGPAKGEFQKRAKLLGIEEQVIFESKVSNLVPYLKSANLLLVTDTDSDSEEVVLKGAAAGIPMVMARTERREDVFEHGTSAFLCDSGDIQAYTDHVNELLNDIGLRRRLVDSAQIMVQQKYHQDPQEYREAYRLSIEQALFVAQNEVEDQR